MRRSSSRAPARALAAVLIPLLAAGSSACNGTEKKGEGPGAEVTNGDPNEGDWWYRAYGPYMDDEFRAAYLATPEDDRFEVHKVRLAEFAHREFLLEDARVNLSADELATYRRLPDAAACQAFLEKLEAEPGRVKAVGG